MDQRHALTFINWVRYLQFEKVSIFIHFLQQFEL